MILSKVVLVVIFLLATAQVSAPIDADLESVSQPMAGVVLMLMAGFAPYLTYKAIAFMGFDMYHAMSAEQEAKASLNRPMPIPLSRRTGSEPAKVLGDSGGGGSGGGGTTSGSSPVAAGPSAGGPSSGAAGGGAVAPEPVAPLEVQRQQAERLPPEWWSRRRPRRPALGSATSSPRRRPDRQRRTSPPRPRPSRRRSRTRRWSTPLGRSDRPWPRPPASRN